MRKIVFLSVVVLSFVFLLSGCGGGTVNQPPQIVTITVDPDPAQVNQNVQIRVTAFDPNGDPIVYHVAVIQPGAAPGKLGGSAVTDLGTNTTGEFSYTPTQAGTHTVVASVTDNKSDEVSDSKDFTVEAPSQPPQGKIEIIEPEDGKKVEAGAEVTVDSSKTDNITSIKYHVYKDSTEVAYSDCLNDTTEWKFTPSSTGTYKICVEGFEDCCCGGDVIATDCVTIEAVENEDPEASITGEDTECCNDITITWKATDDQGLDTGTLTVYWKDYGGTDASETVLLNLGGAKEATGSYGPFHPYEGSVSVKLEVKDIFGRSASTTKSVYISDTSAPKLEVSADAKSAWTTTSTEVSWCFNYAVTRELKMTDCCTNNKLHYEVEYPNGYAEGTIDPQGGKPGWSRSDDLDEEGTYDATLVATDSGCSGNDSHLVAHITIDWTAPEVDLEVPDSTICKSGAVSTFTATDLHMKEWVVKVETVNNSEDATSGTANKEDATFTIKAFDEDYTQASVTVIATDECGNSNEIVKTVYMDGKLGDIVINASAADVNSGAVNIDGIATDNCTVKDATVFIYDGKDFADLSATITGVGSKVVTMQGTITPYDDVEETVCVEFAATDNCCENRGSATECVYFDTKAPSTTSTPVVYVVPDAVVITGYHENIDLTQCTPRATVTYKYPGGVGHQSNDSADYYPGEKDQLIFYFPANSLPDDISKATITYVGVCDAYGNERKVTDQECATSSANLSSTR